MADGWDGFSRLNVETGSGGIVGVFRNGSPETARTVTVPGLLPGRRYVVREAPGSGRGDSVVAEATGAELGAVGFGVSLPREWTGVLFEVAAE